MTDRIKIKPRAGMKVPHPETGRYISGTVSVARTPAVIRLLKDGDAVEVKTTKKQTAKKRAE